MKVVGEKVSGNIELTQDKAKVSLYKDFTGNITFSKNGTVTAQENITLQGVIIAGSDRKGTLNFQESGTVAGDIGKVGSVINELSASGSGGKKVTLEGDVYTKELIIADDGEVELKKKLIAGNIIFKKAQSKLTITNESKTVKGTINGHSSGQGILSIGEGVYFIDESIGDKRTINKVLLSKNANVTFRSNIKTNNGMDLGEEATVIIKDNATNIEGAINGSKDGYGILTFAGKNTATITVDGEVGTTNSLKEINFVSGEIKFTKTVSHGDNKDFIFLNSIGAATVTFNDATNVGNNNFKNNSKTHIPTVVLGNSTEFTKEIANTKQINFQSSAGKTITINTKSSTFANITGEGTLDMKKDGAKISSVVSSGSLLNEVKFTGNGTITGSTYAKNIKAVAGKTATLGGIVYTENGLELLDATSTVSFLDNTTVDSQIKGGGIVEFKGTSTLNKNIGEQVNLVSEVKFLVASNVGLNSNIYSSKINLQGKIDVKQAVEMFGDIDANKATISLEQNALDVSGNITFEGENTINATIEDKNIGKIEASSVNYKNDSKLKVNISCVDRPTGGKSRTYVFLKNTGGVTGDRGIEVVADEGSCSKVTLDTTDTKGITLIQKDTAFQDISRALGRYGVSDAESISNAQALAFALEDTDAYDVVKVIGKTLASGDEKKFKRLMQGLENTNSAVDAIIPQVARLSHVSIARLEYLISPLRPPTVAVAAGDEDYKYGTWADPFYSTARQKAKSDFSGYKGESFGASFGVDSRLSSDLVLGVAFGMSNNKLSYKDIKDGDKAGINSSAFSVYGMKQINDRWYLSSVATLALSSVKRDTKKVSATGDYENVEGKYKTLSFSSEVIATYRQYIGNVAISPMGGLRYVGLNSTRYQETGSTAFQNLNVDIEAVGQLESIIGLKLSTSNIVLKGWQVMPNFNVSASYDIFGQPHSQKLMLGGIGKVATPVYKPARTLYNVGIGVNAAYESWEVALSYNTRISNKYLGHQGNFKLRLNF